MLQRSLHSLARKGSYCSHHIPKLFKDLASTPKNKQIWALTLPWVQFGAVLGGFLVMMIPSPTLEAPEFSISSMRVLTLVWRRRLARTKRASLPQLFPNTYIWLIRYARIRNSPPWRLVYSDQENKTNSERHHVQTVFLTKSQFKKVIIEKSTRWFTTLSICCTIILVVHGWKNMGAERAREKDIQYYHNGSQYRARPQYC